MSKLDFEVEAATPESLGFSSERLQRVETHLRTNYVGRGKFPGTSVLIYRGGKIAHWSMNGYADMARQLPVAEDTIFRIYSMTKPVTAVAFMMLVEEARVALNDPVHKYIPEWENLEVYTGGGPDDAGNLKFTTKPANRPMEIVDLLRHTSGLTYAFQNSNGVDAAYRALGIGGLDTAGSLPDFIAKLTELPLIFS
ncbi:MAG: beta-lactamase family protein, partial [Caldilineaceae bacterium]|nr:beta-lactamase family protein [Caldilineaceae bacterium]